VELTLPLVNLSIADINKGRLLLFFLLLIFIYNIEIIGEYLVDVLLEVVVLPEDKPMIRDIADFLKQGKREASKVIFFPFFLIF
jgi:hypothetical protein